MIAREVHRRASSMDMRPIESENNMFIYRVKKVKEYKFKLTNILDWHDRLKKIMAIEKRRQF